MKRNYLLFEAFLSILLSTENQIEASAPELPPLKKTSAECVIRLCCQKFGGSFRRLCILLAVVGLERAFVGMTAFFIPFNRRCQDR